MTADSTTKLREALAEALGQPCGRCNGKGRESHQVSRDPADGSEDWPCPSCRGIGRTLRHVSPADQADAVLASLVEHRDDVLDVLGAEQVGWGCRIEGRIAASSTRAKRPSHAGGEFYEAVYAFRPKEQPHGN